MALPLKNNGAPTRRQREQRRRKVASDEWPLAEHARGKREENWNWARGESPPGFFVSVASKGLSFAVSLLK
jgi:hypothetical protein